MSCLNLLKLLPFDMLHTKRASYGPERETIQNKIKTLDNLADVKNDYVHSGGPLQFTGLHRQIKFNTLGTLNTSQKFCFLAIYNVQSNVRLSILNNCICKGCDNFWHCSHGKGKVAAGF